MAGTASCREYVAKRLTQADFLVRGKGIAFEIAKGKHWGSTGESPL